jgi:Uncharacterised nucleotidyltransferase
MLPRHPSREARVLLQTVCPTAPGTGQATPPADVDWMAVAQLAEREKLLSVVWPALEARRAPIPDGIANAMRRQTMVTAFRMAAVERQLHRVLQQLDEQRIPVMLMKGSALAVTAYGSFARRPMGDLDLLVHAAHVQTAWNLLRAGGWTPEYEDREGFYDTHQHVCPLVAPGGGNIVVELHRTFLYPQGPFQLTEREVWENAVPVAVDGRQAWVPSPEHQVLLLCVHFAWSHSMRRGLARTIRDLGALAPTVRWQQVVALARRTRAESCCYWTLRLAVDLGGVPVPPEVLHALAPGTPEPMRRALARVIAADALAPREDFSPSLRLGRVTWAAAVRPRAAGHGRARPWAATAGFAAVAHAQPPVPRRRRLRGQMMRASRWVRFARVLFGLA